MDQSSTMRTWCIVFAYAALSLTTFIYAGFTIHPRLMYPGLASLCFGCLASVVLAIRRPDHPLSRACGGVLQQALCGCATVWFECAAARTGSAYIDGSAMAFDRAIGYDWQAYATFVAAHPVFRELLGRAYFSFLPQLTIIIFILGLTHGAKMNRFIIANVFVLTLTVAIFSIAPETSPSIHEKIAIGSAQAMGLPGMSWVTTLHDLRSGSFLQLDATASMAIIGFPSYHCSGAILLSWAALSLRRLRLVVLPLNAVMIASTPYFGGHYIADLAMGTIVALSGIWLSKRVLPEPDGAATPMPVTVPQKAFALARLASLRPIPGVLARRQTRDVPVPLQTLATSDA
ncbi:phosphatase PAP2 family protein [Novosphingobium sp.]|uniref:phosphatase PAP2 family protein n=1 Tax=Novosphingobium sp. TaxID=1874826 RepID=UPI002FDDFAA2